MDGKELFLMIEAISNEKNISQEDVIESLEEALAVATKKRNNLDVRVEVNRHSGEFDTYRRWLIIENDAKFVDDEGTEFSSDLHVYEKDANGTPIGDYLEEDMESVEFGRIAAQIAKQVIIQKVREAERTVIVDNFSERVGEVVMVTVKRVDRGNAYVDMGGIDGMISKYDLIPNESIRKNDRLRAYIKEVKSTPRGAQIFLSRTTNEMMLELFEMEVPEISEGVIEIKGGARDPGLRAKLAVKAKDRRLDPIGTCIGMRGSRVQAVSNELNGERVDIILWDEDPAQFVINAMAPAEVSSIVVDEDKGSMDIAVDEDQLALAIGRGGQNIKLASRLTGWKLNVMSLTDADDLQAKEIQQTSEKLAENLGVDAEVAGVLIDEGYSSLDEIAEADAEVLTQIEEFDSEMVDELQERAQDAQLVKALNDAEATEVLLSIDGISELLAAALVDAGINAIEGLAELSIVELQEIQRISSEDASAIIMTARENAGWFE